MVGAAGSEGSRGWRSVSGGGGAGSFPGPVGRAVHEHLVAGVDQAVEQRFGDDWIRDRRRAAGDLAYTATESGRLAAPRHEVGGRRVGLVEDYPKLCRPLSGQPDPVRLIQPIRQRPRRRGGPHVHHSADIGATQRNWITLPGLIRAASAEASRRRTARSDRRGTARARERAPPAPPVDGAQRLGLATVAQMLALAACSHSTGCPSRHRCTSGSMSPKDRPRAGSRRAQPPAARLVSAAQPRTVCTARPRRRIRFRCRPSRIPLCRTDPRRSRRCIPLSRCPSRTPGRLAARHARRAHRGGWRSGGCRRGRVHDLFFLIGCGQG